MTLFHYLLRQVALGVVVAVVGMFFIAIPGIAVGAVHKLGGVGMGTLLGYLPLVMVDLVPYLLPIGFLLAVVATYGRLAAENEWTAIRMAGIHPLRSAVPALVVAIACSGVLHALVSEISPWLSFARRQYLRDAVITNFKTLSPGRTELQIGEFYLSAPDREGNTFREALIHIPSTGEGEARTLLADTVSIEPIGDVLRIQMTNCRTVHGTQDTTIGQPTIDINLNELFQTDRKTQVSWRFQSTATIRAMLANNEIPRKDRDYARYTIQARYAQTLTPVLFFLLGLPTGLLLRSGTQLAALAVAVGYALLYYLLQLRLSKTIGAQGALPDWVAAWGVSLLGALGGVWLCWRAFRR